MEAIWNDLRSGWRMLRKNPGFAIVAIVTVGIGIGTSTTVFSWIQAVLVNALPGAEEPNRVVALESLTPSGEWVPTSYLDFRDLRDHSKSIESMSVAAPMALAVGDDRSVERVWGELVSGNYFDLLRVKPLRGRFFSPQESGNELSAHPVVVISYSLWKSRYHSDPSAIGSTVRINRNQYQIIGVTPRNFQGSMPGLAFEMWAPATMFGQLSATGDWMLQDRKTRMFRVLARLAPGVSLEQARDQIQSLAQYMARANADTSEGMSATLLPLWKSHYGISDALIAPLGILMAACAVVLLIACANVANLLLVRTASRQKELSIRLALGARRMRLARQLLTESLLVATFGAVTGLLLAAWLGDGLRWLVPSGSTPNLVRPPINVGVLLFAVLLTMVVAVVAGLAPAIQSAWSESNEMLKEAGRALMSSGRSQRLRGFFVTAEVALAVVALIGAAFFVRSFQLTRAIQPGFDPQHVAISEMSLSAAGYDASQADTFCRRLRQTLEKQPGVEAVSYGDYVPLSVAAGSWEDLQIKGYVPAPGENMKLYRNLVAPGYFDAMKIPLIAGRDFTWQDGPQGRPKQHIGGAVTDTGYVMIVSREFVRRFLPNRNPLGQQVQGWGRWFTIVGVAEDSKIYRLTENPVPYFYVPIEQIYRPEMGLKFFVRTKAPLGEAVTALRREAQAIDPAVPVFNAMPLEEYIAASLFPQRIAASLLSTLSSIALLLAAVGLYSVMAYSVARRTSEIGIRMALGAKRPDVLQLILGESLALAVPGLLIGSLLAFGLTRAVSSSLVRVSPSSPSIYAAAALFTVLITLFAAAAPALRAAKVDPMAALRCE
jgi:predicted permease